MLFNSFEFMIFLPVVFLLYWFVFRERRLQNLLVVIASYVFYGWWDWRFLLLIAFTSFCSFGSGLLLEKLEGRRRWQQAVSALNIVLNLAILGVFKYYNFFVENIDALCASLFDYHLDWVTMKVILPVGISFYTFQALSYSIDVYQKKIPATRDIVEFFAYISFFPQLVAGPIERATNLLPQFQQKRTFDYAKAVDGMTQMLWGFFKKIVVADNCAIIVNQHWNEFATLSSPVLLILALLFSFQIYCDFSGYSDIAIGTARLFGFNLKCNFNLPYFSRSIPEFWRRWHISLMTWFRDYIYFPLGGSRCVRWKVFRNTIIVFMVSGLWHGANWTFIAWGLYHGLLICLYILLGVNTKSKDIVAKGRRLPTLKELEQVYRNRDSQYQQWRYRVILTQRLTNSSGIFSVVCDEALFSQREHHNRTTKKPPIVIINYAPIADMAAGDTIELTDKQTLWGLGTVTLWAKNKQRNVTLRQFSFRRKDALAYLAAKKTAKHTETCPTCGQPMPQNF